MTYPTVTHGDTVTLGSDLDNAHDHPRSDQTSGLGALDLGVVLGIVSYGQTPPPPPPPPDPEPLPNQSWTKEQIVNWLANVAGITIKKSKLGSYTKPELLQLVQSFLNDDEDALEAARARVTEGS